MAGSGGQDMFRQAVRHCHWQSVRQLALRGCSLEQRDVAVSQAVRHSQWWLVSQLVQLGVSQQHRDLALHKAVRYCLWDIVDELLAAGVSSEKRDFALQRGLRQRQWDLVSGLLALGVGPELRDLVVTEAMQHGQWHVVLAALRLGVKQELVNTVFQGVVSQNRWEHAPSLVRLVNSSDHTDFVLQAAIRACQWGCVRQLIKTGLTPPQQDLVCREALEWAHTDCAMELLRQGCEPACAERIVLEAFRWSPCWALIEVLKEDRTNSRVRDVVLQIAKRYGCWTEYLMILKEAVATEKEMAELVSTALQPTNVGLLLRLLSLFVSARRVFKQMLLRKRFPAYCIIALHAHLVSSNPGLAFYMMVAQEMWDRVLGMFRDACMKERRFALKHAARKGVWKVVRKMVKSRALRRKDCCYAFLQAARCGKWRLALKMSSFLEVSQGDKVFALRLWLQQGLWNCFSDVYVKWLDSGSYWFSCNDTTLALLEAVLEESITADKIKPFRDAIRKMECDEIDGDFIIQTALKYDKCRYIFELCGYRKSPDDFERALRLAAEKGKWKLVSDLMKTPGDFVEMYDYDSEYEDFYLSQLLFCVRAIMPESDVWPTVVPSLNSFCSTLNIYDALGWEPEESDADSTHNVESLIDWCLNASYKNIFLVLSMMYVSDEGFRRVAEELDNTVESDVVSFCFVLSVRKSAWELAATCLPHMSVDDAKVIVTDLQDGAEYSNLIDKCRQRGQHTWVIYIGSFSQAWDEVRTDIEQCQDVSVVDFVVEYASSHGEWSIVQSQLHKCSSDTSLLCKIFNRALLAGQPEICTTLVSKVNLVQGGVSIQSLLYKAVTSSGDREEMLRLCIKFGFSTHIKTCTCRSSYGCSVCLDCPMKTALNNGQMPLVKLLHEAGACSNNRLFLCKENVHLRTRLQGQGRHDIVEYLDHAATTPRTLQDMCRLQVSHLIGCQPGRQDRIMALEIPWPARKLISFDDVLS